ncbi:hypothetical protein CapIbe_013620 [Capra ibex]
MMQSRLSALSMILLATDSRAEGDTTDRGCGYKKRWVPNHKTTRQVLEEGSSDLPVRGRSCPGSCTICPSLSVYTHRTCSGSTVSSSGPWTLSSVETDEVSAVRRGTSLNPGRLTEMAARHSRDSSTQKL